jgi:DNA-binding LytR/AlgR family response regulator
MQALNCLIVEDEPLAANLIKEYIQEVQGLELKGVCADAVCAMEKLRNEKIDVIFLDINLPKLSGIDFLKSIKNNYHVIFTTAYHQYALQGYELNVVDYLMKPIEFSRFLQAVNKVFDRHELKTEEPAIEKRHYFFNVDKKRVKVFAEEIVYIESLKDYVRIHTAEKSIVTKFQIGEIEQFLEEKYFLRIHKSFVVNAGKISSYRASRIEIGGVTLPIGRTYKEQVDTFLNASS